MNNMQTGLPFATQQMEQYINGIRETNSDKAATKVVIHHLSSFEDNDLQAVMSDYTHDSVLVTQDATYNGIQEIEAFFADLITQFPKGKTTLELDKLVVKNELAYIVWHANTPTLKVTLGSDTFIITGGKIRQQTFVGLIESVS